MDSNDVNKKYCNDKQNNVNPISVRFFVADCETVLE